MKTKLKLSYIAKIAIYNLKVGRNHSWRRDWLIEQIEERKLKVVFLQEADGYVDFLKRVAQACNMDLYQYKTSKDSGNCAMLISKDLGNPSKRRAIFRRMKRMWWGLKTSTWRAPRVFIAEKRGGVYWGSGHRAAYQSHNANNLANDEYDDTVIETIQSRPKPPWVVGMDWNDGINNGDLAKYEKRTGGEFHGVKGDSGIDFWLSVPGNTGHYVQITDEYKVKDSGGSDHPMRVAVAHVYTSY